MEVQTVGVFFLDYYQNSLMNYYFFNINSVLSIIDSVIDTLYVIINNIYFFNHEIFDYSDRIRLCD